MNCPHCGKPTVCQTCGIPLAQTPSDRLALLRELLEGTETQRGLAEAEQDQNDLLIVARGHSQLAAQIQALVGELGWVRVIEDRRREPTLLPREGREGGPYVSSEDET